MTDPFRIPALLILSALLPGVALADCAAPLEALAKSWQQARLAQYEVSSPEQAPPSKPAMVRIGKTIWTDLTGSGKFMRTDIGPSEEPLAISMKRAKGQNCQPLGDGTYHGQPVVKYKLDPSAGTNTMGGVTLWVSKASGLPVYHGFDKTAFGGYAWVYGDAVKEPAK